MSKTINIYSARIELMRDGYNIIESTIYDETIVKEANELAEKLEGYEGVPF